MHLFPLVWFKYLFKFEESMKKGYIIIFLGFILIATAFMLFVRIDRTLVVDVKHIHLDSIQNVIEIDDSLVVPVLYDTLLIQKFTSAEEKKQQFINQVLPAILIVKFQLENQSKVVKKVIKKLENEEKLTKKEANLVDSLMIRYGAETLENLLIRLKIHPTSLVLAQAALESGWGSSRFAIEGNNLFGMKSLPGDSSRIKSFYSRGSKNIYLKSYDNVAQSIDHYFVTLGRSDVYNNFRNKRYEEVDVFQLIGSLSKYSEKGKDYTTMLKKMVEWNNMVQYDSYVIDPNYIKKESFLKSIELKF